MEEVGIEKKDGGKPERGKKYNRIEQEWPDIAKQPSSSKRGSQTANPVVSNFVHKDTGYRSQNSEKNGHTRTIVLDTDKRSSLSANTGGR